MSTSTSLGVVYPAALFRRVLLWCSTPPVARNGSAGPFSKAPIASAMGASSDGLMRGVRNRPETAAPLFQIDAPRTKLVTGSRGCLYVRPQYVIPGNHR